MLFKNTVSDNTYELLTKLMLLESLKSFALVGGTNLSLRYGHRISIDIDLFTNTKFVPSEIFEEIKSTFKSITKLGERGQSLWLNINNVKVDIILHEYKYIKPIEIIEGIRFLSVNDIIPMKLEAAATRGVKKDFWDLATLLEHFSLSEMLDLHQQKYPNSDLGHILLSLSYFEDADKELIDPVDLSGTSWIRVKNKMKKALKQYFDK